MQNGNRKFDIGYYLSCDWTWTKIVKPVISIIFLPLWQQGHLLNITTNAQQECCHLPIEEWFRDKFWWSSTSLLRIGTSKLINMQQPSNVWGPAELSCQALGKLLLICLCITKWKMPWKGSATRHSFTLPYHYLLTLRVFVECAE